MSIKTVWIEASLQKQFCFEKKQNLFDSASFVFKSSNF